MLYYCLVKITLEKKTIAALMMMCVPVVGLRVPSSCCGSPPYRTPVQRYRINMRETAAENVVEEQRNVPCNIN